MQEDTKSQVSGKWGSLFGFISLILLFATLASLLLQRGLAFGFFLLLGIASLAAFVVLRRREVLDFFVSRQARYGTNVGLSVLLVIGIAVIVNVIVSQRFDKEADWTADKIFTLSDQTKKILQGLDQEIKVLAFFSVDPTDERLERSYRLAKDLLRKYDRETDKLQIEFVDPVADARRFQEYDLQFEGTTVFELGNKRELVTTIDEQKFTSAILKVVRDETKKIYVSIGHEERDIYDYDRTGYSDARKELEKQNYKVETLSLTTQPDIPADCAVLILHGPKALLMAHEVDAISRYLDRNGKLFLMLDPSINSAEDPHQGLVGLMDKWGVRVGNDLVLDRFRPAFFIHGGARPEAPYVDNFEFHRITQHVYRQVTFHLARSITPKPEAKKNLSVKSLAKTTDEISGSWGETKRKNNGTFDADSSYTEGKDTPAPVSLAVAIQLEESESTTVGDQSAEELKESKTRIVVVGDSDFATNFFFQGTGGGDFFLNALNWLTLEEDLIAIRPVDPTERSLRAMTPSEAVFVQMAAIFLMPLLIFMIGVGVWWRRR